MSQFDNSTIEILSNNERLGLRKKIADQSYLPSHAEFEQAFPDNESWKKFAFNDRFYEVLNKEFIDALASYIVDRISGFEGASDDPTIILELGSGDGRLTHFLELAVQAKLGNVFKIIATDSGELAMPNVYPVEKINSNLEALNKYSPKIVLCSWMPYRRDWTADIRSMPSVEEYILIGEANGGCCGDPWRTWGTSVTEQDNIGQLAPYKADNFTDSCLEDISAKQICRIDSLPNGFSYSQTVSFKRNK